MRSELTFWFQQSASGVSVLDQGGHALILLDGKQIGYINYNSGYCEDFPAFEVPHNGAYFRYINVSPAFRGKGYGTKAFYRFQSSMRNKGFRVLYAIPETKRLEKYWERLGFQNTHVRTPKGTHGRFVFSKRI